MPSDEQTRDDQREHRRCRRRPAAGAGTSRQRTDRGVPGRRGAGRRDAAAGTAVARGGGAHAASLIRSAARSRTDAARGFCAISSAVAFSELAGQEAQLGLVPFGDEREVDRDVGRGS